MVSAIFPAAGQGKRMHLGLNKAFLELAGQPMLVRTLKRFSEIEEIGELIIVVGADEIIDTRRLLARTSGLRPCKVVEGGSERQYSVYNGLQCVAAAADIVLVHDAARPFVSVKTIKDVIAAARSCGGAVAAVPAKSTIKVVGEDGLVESTPDRSRLWEIQTPQGFRREVLERANERALDDGFLGTDDASLVEHAGGEVRVVQSDYSNIKVTTPEDIIVAEAFLRQQQPLSDMVQQAAERTRAGLAEAWQKLKDSTRQEENK